MITKIQGHKTFFSTGNGQLKDSQKNVIFLHGAGMDHTVFVMPSRYFARHNFNVYAFDLPCHGLSEGLICENIDAFADWLASAVNELGIATAAIVGHSMGSLIALNFAARYPKRTRTLSLLGTSTPMPVSDALLSAAKENEHDAIDMANTWSHSAFGQLGGNETPGICMKMIGQRLLEKAPDNIFYKDLNACNQFKDGETLAKRIDSKTLVVVGNQDKMTAPLNALRVAEIVPNSKVREIENCGHSMLSEQPNAVLDALITIV